MMSTSARKARRRAFIAAFSGWMLDGYDYTILTLVLLDIQRDLSVGSGAIGALGTATLIMRLVGGVVTGRAADRWGRKWPLVFSIVWFSVFSFLSGFSRSYAMLFALRSLFGLGMGGEWSAGMSLVLEHWPAEKQGIITGVLQGAFSWGFVLAALVFQVVFRYFETESPWLWRVLLWSGLAPAALVFWLRRRIPESPLWLANRATYDVRPALRGLLPTRVICSGIIRATVVLGALMFAYQAMSFWYASLLRLTGRAPLAYLTALNVGGVAGAAFWGAATDTRLGHRGSITVASAASIVVLPLFLYASTVAGLWFGALLTGMTGAGIIGVAPSYVGGQFATTSRGIGSGFVYHAAAVIGALAPYLLGVAQDRSWSLQGSMAASIGAASLVAILVVWSGPARSVH